MGSGTFVSYREYTDEEEIAETTSPVELPDWRAISTFQKSQGLQANGKPSQDLLKTMRRVAAEKGLARPDAASD